MKEIVTVSLEVTGYTAAGLGIVTNIFGYATSDAAASAWGFAFIMAGAILTNINID